MSNYKMNALPLIEGNTDLTIGTFPSGTFVNVGDVVGELTVTYKTGTIKTVTVPVGMAVEATVTAVVSVVIAAGTFHKA